MYYAHTTDNPDKSDWQPLKDHLTQVAALASSFASDFSAPDFAYVSGILHDIGKYSERFQSRLEGASIRVDHSTAGAREAGLLYDKAQSRILSYIIAGHHTGLLNFGTEESGLHERLQKAILEDYSSYKREITNFEQVLKKIPIQPLPKRIGFSFSFFIRMLYSCLVDADSLDTEAFSNPEISNIRKKYDSFNQLSINFFDHLNEKISHSEDTQINRYRNQILEQSLLMAKNPPGFYSLTVPTGGGKTLSSMAFSLKHLEKNNLKRIFYVIPYTSIIEQNAKIFRDIFGDQNVLEHHSNFDPKDEGDDDYETKERWYKITTENWDIPITVTTNVQFFESLFAHKRSRNRKIHNLSRSVIILDEAQMLPTEYLKPALQALSELVVNYGSSVIFCTATQPKIGDLLDDSMNITEIMDSPDELYEVFRRVSVTHLGKVSDDELISQLNSNSQVLCIVNTRKHAQVLFDLLSDPESTIHLSAKMCPVHRREKLQEIRDRLATGRTCRVISTQLIEAGVDVDFPIVFRAMTGIDSIAQAAGRCNREGKHKSGELFIFNSTEKHGKATSWQRKIAEIGEMVLESHQDPLSLSAISEFFSRLYFYEGDDGLDQKKILASIEERYKELAFPFEDIGHTFKLIEEDTRDVIIPFKPEVERIIDQIRISGFPGGKTRKLQGYSVSVYPHEFTNLEKSGVIETLGDRFHVLVNPRLYCDMTGLLQVEDEDIFGGLLIT